MESRSQSWQLGDMHFTHDEEFMHTRVWPALTVRERGHSYMEIEGFDDHVNYIPVDEVLLDNTERHPGSDQSYVSRKVNYLASTYGKRNESNDFTSLRSELHPFYYTIDWDGYLMATCVGDLPLEGEMLSRTWIGSAAARGQLKLYAVPDDPGAIGHDIEPEIPDDELILQLASRLNPSRPHVDVPLAVFELRDVPGMLKNMRNFWKENPAGTYLGLEFGWKPLVKDVRKLLERGRQIEKRLITLQRMANGKSVTRSSKRFPHIETKTIRYPVAFTVMGETVEMELEETWTMSRWVVLHYKYDRIAIPTLPEDQYDAALKATYGAAINGSVLWNAIPWTWMIDWFSTLGDAIDAARNTLGCSLDKVSLMKHTTHTITILESQRSEDPFVDAESILPAIVPEPSFWSFDDPNCQFGAFSASRWTRSYFRGSFRSEEKRRIVRAPPEPQTNLPIGAILGDKWKVSILGALATVRVLGR